MSAQICYSSAARCADVACALLDRLKAAGLVEKVNFVDVVHDTDYRHVSAESQVRQVRKVPMDEIWSWFLSPRGREVIEKALG
jgi:hypothetical protein